MNCLLGHALALWLGYHRAPLTSKLLILSVNGNNRFSLTWLQKLEQAGFTSSEMSQTLTYSKSVPALITQKHKSLIPQALQPQNQNKSLSQPPHLTKRLRALTLKSPWHFSLPTMPRT